MRERLDETMKMAPEELKVNQVRYKKNYDKKTKDQLFSEGNKILVMLQTYNNKFVMQWKKLYQILQKLGSNGYKISDGKEKNYYYANMLKNYYGREDEEVELKEKIPRIYEKSLLEFGTCRQKENVSDIKLGTELSDSQGRQLKNY